MKFYVILSLVLIFAWCTPPQAERSNSTTNYADDELVPDKQNNSGPTLTPVIPGPTNNSAQPVSGSASASAQPVSAAPEPVDTLEGKIEINTDAPYLILKWDSRSRISLKIVDTDKAILDQIKSSNGKVATVKGIKKQGPQPSWSGDVVIKEIVTIK